MRHVTGRAVLVANGIARMLVGKRRVFLAVATQAQRHGLLLKQFCMIAAMNVVTRTTAVGQRFVFVGTFELCRRVTRVTHLRHGGFQQIAGFTAMGIVATCALPGSRRIMHEFRGQSQGIGGMAACAKL